MTTALFTHAACLAHDNGYGNPETPERLAAILHELAKPAYADVVRYEALRATKEDIARVHDLSYVEHILSSVPEKGYYLLEEGAEEDKVAYEETALSAGSGEAALRAAGAAIAAIDDVLSGKITNAFCAVRPPGHHAGRAHAAGFCLFNNIAIGAMHALDTHNFKRIAIADFDVHHGDGTQAWARGNSAVLFCSSHQMPLYPGSGGVDESGPLNNIVNMPLRPGTDGAEFLKTWRERGLAAIDAFKPELILVSAGFDAHRDDPLADINLVEDNYFRITRDLCALAQKHCSGHIVSTLEGGYNIAALAASAGAHVKALMASD